MADDVLDDTVIPNGIVTQATTGEMVFIPMDAAGMISEDLKELSNKGKNAPTLTPTMMMFVHAIFGESGVLTKPLFTMELSPLGDAGSGVTVLELEQRGDLQRVVTPILNTYLDGGMKKGKVIISKPEDAT